MAVTLKDVAALVGVSVNTVSLALKDKPEIKLKTRERVKAAAEALGYRPNLNARSLVLRQTNTLPSRKSITLSGWNSANGSAAWLPGAVTVCWSLRLNIPGGRHGISVRWKISWRAGWMV